MDTFSVTITMACGHPERHIISVDDAALDTAELECQLCNACEDRLMDELDDEAIKAVYLPE